MGQPEKQPKICKSPRSGTILPPIPKGQTRNPAGYSKKGRERDEFKAVCAEIWKDAPKDLINAVKAGVGSRKYDFVREGLERFFGKVPNKNENNDNVFILQSETANTAYEERLKNVKNVKR